MCDAGLNIIPVIGSTLPLFSVIPGLRSKQRRACVKSANVCGLCSPENHTEARLLGRFLASRGSR